jgi:hypothetical protein
MDFEAVLRNTLYFIIYIFEMPEYNYEYKALSL